MKRGNPEKAQATREANQQVYADQSIQVHPSLRLFRLDEMNWAIEGSYVDKIVGKKGSKFYYGRLIHALQDIPHRLLNDGKKKTLEDILEQQDEIRKTIDRLFNMKLSHFRPVEAEKA